MKMDIKKIQSFEIHEDLESIIAEDYLSYASINFKRNFLL